MFEKLITQRNHIPLHKIWAFLSDEVQLDVSEHIHMLLCRTCDSFLAASLRAETFGEALGIWLSENKLGRAS